MVNIKRCLMDKANSPYKATSITCSFIATRKVTGQELSMHMRAVAT